MVRSYQLNGQANGNCMARTHINKCVLVTERCCCLVITSYFPCRIFFFPGGFGWISCMLWMYRNHVVRVTEPVLNARLLILQNTPCTWKEFYLQLINSLTSNPNADEEPSAWEESACGVHYATQWTPIVCVIHSLGCPSPGQVTADDVLNHISIN